MPQAVKGRIRRIKWAVLLLTLSIYYVTPFLRWDRGPERAGSGASARFRRTDASTSFSSRSGRRTSIWSRGFSFCASTILILTNALSGRLWCGFACPQTVWTDLFLLVERVIEGDRRQRLKNLGARL